MIKVTEEMTVSTATPFPVVGLKDQLYHANRWYNSFDGKWLSEDPLAYGAGDVNFARYVGNMPTMETDPSGQSNSGSSGGSAGGGNMSSHLSTGFDEHPTLVVGYLGRGGAVEDVKSGIHAALRPIASSNEFEVWEFATQIGNVYYDSRPEMRAALKGIFNAFNPPCTVRVILVGHSYGGSEAISMAKWFKSEIKKNGATPEIYLLTIDAIVKGSNGDTETATVSGTSEFVNIYQTQDENGSLGVVGGPISGATNIDVTSKLNSNLGNYPGDSGHTAIDNYLTDVTEGYIQRWAKKK